MLLQRVLTAVPLGLLVIWFVLTQTTDYVFYALLFAVLVSGWEWARLCGYDQPVIRAIYALAILGSTYLIHAWLSAQSSDALNVVLFFSVIWWSLIIYRMSTNDPASASDEKSVFKMLIGFITLIPPILALTHIHQSQQGPFWMLFAMSLVWIADSGAYFSGKKFGKNKLAPRLSPGKTKEGLYGAVFATELYCVLAGYFFELSFIQIIELLVIGFFATLLSVAGDLFISWLKRERGVKDTGAILPGHGGALDRIDSILSSAPFFALVLNLMIFSV